MSTPSSTRTFEFNYPDFLVGTAEYPDGPTGCTVFIFPDGGAEAAVDVRGGAAALRESTILDPLSTYAWVDSIVLAGGSTYGLEAASGVAERLLKQREGKTDFMSIPSVPSAVVYDFGDRKNSLYPDKTLGAQAFDRARTNQVTVGRAGAGANVRVGKYFGGQYAEKSGQGAAFFEKGPLKIFALSVVNALGNVVDRNGKVILGSREPKTGERFSIVDRLMQRPFESFSQRVDKAGNTTISILITNAKFTRPELQRIAAMAHTSMARVIEPFHTPDDGDTLFVVTTASVERPEGLTASEIGTLGGRLLQDAVLSTAR